MFEHDEELITRVAAELRRPVPADLGLDARILTAVAAAPRPGSRLGRAAAAWDWLRRPRPVRVSPLGALAAAAALAALLLWKPWGTGGVATPAQVQFVLVEPRAATVSLLGDFNDWDPAATPLEPARPGVWTVTVPLAPGRHRYSFLVNGTRWVADPRFPRAAGEDFGVPSSVVTVGGDL